MTNDFKSENKMNMAVVRSSIKPWTAPDGSVRYYVNDFIRLLVDSRGPRTEVCRYDYDETLDRAPAWVVSEKIERNILPGGRTKVYIGDDARIHIYGYAIGPMGTRMGLPQEIERAVAARYGMATEEQRSARTSDIGHLGTRARIGDTVEVTDGRKERGKVFSVSKVTHYRYSMYSEPSVYLWDEEGFKVSAHNCTLREVGYAR